MSAMVVQTLEDLRNAAAGEADFRAEVLRRMDEHEDQAMRTNERVSQLEQAAGGSGLSPWHFWIALAILVLGQIATLAVVVSSSA